MSRARRPRGYSLYELLATLALTSTVLLVGVPSFEGIVAEQRLRTETDRLFHAVHLARKASVVRRRAVSLCASADGTACDGDGDWSRGWIVFVDEDRDSPPARDDGEALLIARRIDPRVRLRANRRAFTFRSTELRATNGTLVLCDRAGGDRSRALVISYTGRPRVTRQDRRGDPYSCAD